MKSNFCDTTVFLLNKTVAHLNSQAQKTLHSKLDISYFQFLILCMIDYHPKSTQKGLSVMLNYTEAAISKQVEELRKSGFLKREVDPNNRRQHILALTDLGQQIVHKAYKLLTEAGELFLDKLDKSEKTSLNKQLQKLSNSLIFQNC